MLGNGTIVVDATIDLENAPCKNLRVSVFGSAYSLKSFENLNLTGTIKITNFNADNFESYKISSSVGEVILED